MAEPRPSGEIYGYDFDEVFAELLFYLSRYPDYVCSPRGQKIKECLVQTLILEDPRSRLIHNPEREANYGFAAGEFLWYWQGRRDLEMMLYYNKRMAAFSDDGKTLNSAYGFRLRGGIDIMPEIDSQWNNCVVTLVDDPDSRRAVMTIFGPFDLDTAVKEGSKDVPCTLSLQFFIRDNRLHLHVQMRSNDAIWGLTSDAFSFTLMQECMLLELQQKDPKLCDLELGNYYHSAGSLHLYERHFDLAERVIKRYDIHDWPHQAMPALTSVQSLGRLCIEEERLRTKKIDQIDCTYFEGGELWLATQLNMHRLKRDAEENRVAEKKEVTP